MSIRRMTTISALFLLALLPVGSGYADARPVAFRSMNGGGPPGAQKKAGTPLIDHGGLVLGSSTAHAIYWGKPADFPSDLQSGMAAFLGGLSGSSYLALATQYMRGATI